eukprot:CAMPEP_0182564268 /NCGR_PEP_ID=MMETSP1324-20130603/6234_1 /TAXON_ID=236786 /ORGANISM="Florenciella sp., Strain RCC1587" /LENGTH=475 /DNA_ID=CAMNT_0024777675 /DNA_START=269 /DNA_END=1696 /DNA_ORIENTATION=-
MPNLNFLMDSARGSSDAGSSARTGGADTGRSASSASSGTARSFGGNIFGQIEKKGKKEAGKENQPENNRRQSAIGPDELSSDEMESHVRRKRQLEIYRKFMNIAKTSMTEKHASHLKDLEASDHMPMGRVSSRVYDSIWNDRTFDKYFRLVPQRMNKKQQMLANMKATFAKQGDKSSGDSSYGSNKNAMINEMLQTKKEAIGEKDWVRGPVGTAAPPKRILNSEDNHFFYSYDGEWKNGKMHGWGTYKFADGHTYKGRWKDGRMHGEGVAEYSSGHMYTGSWEIGKYHGRGCFEYDQVGKKVKYDGMWKEGHRHGYGELTLPSGVYYKGDWFWGKQQGIGEVGSVLTDKRFVGRWEKGLINGTGTLFNGPRKAIPRSWRSHGGMTFREVVDLLHKEALEDKHQKERDNQAIYGIRIKIQTQDYVNDCREDILEHRREIKAGENAQRLEYLREQRLKKKQAMLESLTGKVDEDEED